MFQALARDRLERLNASPSSTPRTYFRAYSVLFLVLSVDFLWIKLSLMTYSTIGSSVYLLLLFEPCSIAFERPCRYLKAITLALLIHGFQLLDMWINHLAVKNSDCRKSKFLDSMTAGSLLEWKDLLNRHLGFVLDMATLVMALAHFLYIWWLHGLAFPVVDAVLLLYVRALLSVILKRIKGYIKLRIALGSLYAALPDATSEELRAYDDECAICREPMGKAKKLHCNHLFHLGCLRSWLDQGLNEVYSCSTCRKPLFAGRTENEANPRTTEVSSDELLARQLERDLGLDPRWLQAWSGQGVDMAGPSRASRSVGLGRVHMMMRHLASVGESYAQNALDDAAWSLWPMSPSQASTSSATVPPGGGGRTGGGLHLRSVSSGTNESLANILAMAETVREVMPHVPDEIIFQDLQRTNSVAVTVNNLLQIARFVNETVWQRVTGVAILHYSNSNGPASGPLPVPKTDVSAPWSAMTQPRAIRQNTSASGARPNPQGSFHYGQINITNTYILRSLPPTMINGSLRATLNGISFVHPITPVRLADRYKVKGAYKLDFPDRPIDSRPPRLDISMINATYKGFIQVVFQNNDTKMQSFHVDGYTFFVVGMDFGVWSEDKKGSYNNYDAISRSTIEVYPGGWTAGLISLDNVGVWNIRVENLDRWYLGEETYMRIINPEENGQTEMDPPGNVLYCGALRNMQKDQHHSAATSILNGHLKLMFSMLMALVSRGPRPNRLRPLGHDHRYSEKKAYGQSKLANLLHSNALSRKLQEEGVNITVNSVHPGLVTTNLFRHSGLGMSVFKAMSFFLWKNIPQGAATTCYVALHPSLKGVTGKYFADCNVTTPSNFATDKSLADKLWDFSIKLIDSLPN
ncbi:hypothetical protein F2Q70_00035068 [Brassica cretica]|uniref:RING-type E3 ubiquitin transferase n=2 Tax=Brassica cretica TaxID=69181 RepID=A0A8S9K1J5_BRACR|nr:hypothetical protein F2Q70_00035068 [Brassica cretica]